ncbi:MAG TPA: DMT family transporter [Polyangia bacterium]
MACAIGVLGFSGTAPMTRAVVKEAGPWAASFGRIVVAAAVVLAVEGVAALARRLRSPRVTPCSRPRWRASERVQLVLIASCVAVAFPWLHAQATVERQAYELTLLAGLLPFLTGGLGRLRSGAPTPRRVWLGMFLGSAAIAGFALSRSTSVAAGRGFGLGLLAMVAAAVGYSESAILTRRFGAWTVISRAVLVALAFDLALAAVLRPAWPAPHVWRRPLVLVGISYLGVVSMLFASMAWYRGLARAGVTRGAVVQLAQTPLGLVWSALWLGEPLGPASWATGALVLLSLWLALGRGGPAPVPRRAPGVLPSQDGPLAAPGAAEVV